MKLADIDNALISGTLRYKLNGKTVKVRGRKPKTGEKGRTVYVGFNTPMVITSTTKGFTIDKDAH